MRIIQSVLLLVVLVAMEACVFRSYPLYHPLSQSSTWDEYRQGYFEYQIDDRTYLVGYSNYITAYAIFEGDGYVRSLKGAQEYAFYRAAEFTKAQGQQFFVVLYKDDWYATGYVPASGIGKYRTGPHIRVSPGAWAIIRIVDTNAAALLKDDNRVYSADTVLASLAQENSGLTCNDGAALLPNHTEQYSSKMFNRWRSASTMDASVPAPGVLREGSFGYKDVDFETGDKVTQSTPGRFTIAVWQDFLISPIHILWQCIWHADREGYKVFKLENWAVKEHIGGNAGNYAGKTWFRSSVDVVPQQQKDPTILEPVFVVEEIRSRLNAGGAILPY